MRRKRIVLWLAALALIAAGVAAVAVGMRKRPSAAAVQPDSGAATPAELSMPGLIQAGETIKVPASIEGRINAYHVEVGDEVYEGQLLAEIGNDQLVLAEQHAVQELEQMQQRVNLLEGAIAAARLETSRAAADALRLRAELERSRKVYERQKLLLSAGATPRLVFEKAQQEFQSLEIESKNLDAVEAAAEARASSLQQDLDAARKLLETKGHDLEAAKAKTEAGHILSPATGVIAGRRGQAGEDVNPAIEDLFLIATDLSQLEVVLEPDPKQRALIQPGLPAVVIVADLPNEGLPGAVKSVDEEQVVVEFGNPSQLVKPGHTAQVRIQLRPPAGAAR